jgi:hypothetical protein
MSADNEPAKPIRKVIPITLMLLILGVFFSIYFFKYVPDQQSTLNNRGYRELQQIEQALDDKEAGYKKAIQVSLQNTKANSRLLASFSMTPYWPPPECKMPNSSRQIGNIMIIKDLQKDAMQLTYPLVCPATSAPAHDTIFYMSIGLEKVLTPIITTYRDIFENYLLILDSDSGNTDRPHSPERFSRPRRGEILYNSGNLPMEYPVNMDSLVNTRDGFSLLNVHNVTVEGNAYKLFLYPMQWGGERVVLAGLISIGNYNAGVKNIPFTLVALPGIIILLLLIHLPVLKIYLIGIYERICDMDIRLLIGTYFIAAFAAFFLFSWLFIAKAQVLNNRKNLNTLSTKIQKAFHAEIDSICRQLVVTDSTYAADIGPSLPMVQVLRHGPVNDLETNDSIRLDALLRPLVYPYPENIFLVDSAGKLAAIWNAITKSGIPNLFSLKDRQYFKDFKNGHTLADTLHTAGDTSIPFNIQPVLSKLDGEYAVNLVIQSARSWKTLHDIVPEKGKPGDRPDTIRRPWLIGISAKMHSVFNTQLPVGYNFSIIDENGNSLYDSKPGKALLSNFLSGSEDPSAIHESAVYRNRRYFDEHILNGRKSALLSTPIRGLPYTLLTYYNLDGRDEFEFHLIGLSSIFTGGIILLILLSALINELTRKKYGLILAPSSHFEWLQPTPQKKTYYQFMMKGMLLLLGIYFLAWLIAECIPNESDFSLFFITLLFPFNIAIYYYSLRQSYYSSCKQLDRTGTNERILGVMLFLCTLIGLIILFYLFGEPRFGWQSAVLLLTQAGWVAAILLLLRTFNSREEFKETTPADSYLNHYSMAIICGVFMISLIPACGIFWVLYRQETTLRLNTERLETIRNADARRDLVNAALADHKFFASRSVGSPDALGSPGPASSSCALDNGPCRALKFQHGLYLLHEDSLLADPPTETEGTLAHSLALPYIRWHQVFFPEDSSVMAWTQRPLAAGDGSWRFTTTADRTLLKYTTQKDGLDKEPFHLLLGRQASGSTFSLLWSETLSTGAPFILVFFGAQLLSLLLSLILTRSLAGRVFLLNLFERQKEPLQHKNHVKERTMVSRESAILKKLLDNGAQYQIQWKQLKPMEKFILYDFAKDGFTNYRTAWFIYKLKEAKLLLFREERLQFSDPAFREYVLQQSEDRNVQTYLKIARQKGSWQAFKIPLMILFATFGLFIFFTQDALYQKITGLAASFISMRPLLLSLFEKGNNGNSTAGPEKADPPDPKEEQPAQDNTGQS